CFAIGTFVVVLYTFVKSRLLLSWRAWLTQHVMAKYFANRAYYRINHDPTIDNPDERIQQDVDGVVTGALSLLLTILGSIITFYHAEDREAKQLEGRFNELLKNWSQLIGWTRNLGFIQTASDYFTVAIPFLILGPLYFAKQVEMGTIGMAAMAFGQVLSALT